MGCFIYTISITFRKERFCIANINMGEKTWMLHANNKGADQPARTRSLISAFVIRLLERSESKVAPCEISIFKLVSVAE